MGDIGSCFLSRATALVMHGSKSSAFERSLEESRGARELPLDEKVRDPSKSSRIVPLGESGENIRGSMLSKRPEVEGGKWA